MSAYTLRCAQNLRNSRNLKSYLKELMGIDNRLNVSREEVRGSDKVNSIAVFLDGDIVVQFLWKVGDDVRALAPLGGWF